MKKSESVREAADASEQKTNVEGRKKRAENGAGGNRAT